MDMNVEVYASWYDEVEGKWKITDTYG